MNDVLTRARQRWNLDFKRKTSDEYSSACPFCGGRDRFLIFEDGGYWCRQCQCQGWVNDDRPMTETERRLSKLEWEQRRAKREREEHERRLSALERMHSCTDHLRYHKALFQNDDAIGYWLGEGVTFESIERFKLGYCQSCPTARGPSYTIPIINQGKLENIRHRLVTPDGGKYRPHMAGLGIQLFNADAAHAKPEALILAEGEKKAIVTTQHGFDTVGIVGKRSWKREWLDWFDGIRTVYVALDPDAMESAYRLGALFGGRGRVVHLPAKIDDMFVKYGATPDDLQGFLDLARPVRGNGAKSD